MTPPQVTFKWFSPTAYGFILIHYQCQIQFLLRPTFALVHLDMPFAQAKLKQFVFSHAPHTFQGEFFCKSRKIGMVGRRSRMVYVFCSVLGQVEAEDIVLRILCQTRGMHHKFMSKCMTQEDKEPCSPFLQRMNTSSIPGVRSDWDAIMASTVAALGA